MTPKASSKQTRGVLSHWYSVIEGAQFSPQEFYSALEAEIAKRKMPQLQVSRVEFFEASVISDKRVYLRLARERYAFDVCAAPFGTGFFFSLRLIEKPRSWLQFALMLVLGGATLYLLAKLIGNPLVLALILLGLVLLSMVFESRLRETAEAAKERPETIERFDFHAWLLNTAVFGSLYERASAETYFRHDTRLLFLTIISDLVKRKVDEATGKGGTPVAGYEYSPILGGLYQPVIKNIGRGSA